MQIEITRGDEMAAIMEMEAGEPRSCCCPVAQALKRYFPEKEVVTTRSFSDVGDIRYTHPPDLYDAICSWDMGNPFKFGVYTLARG